MTRVFITIAAAVLLVGSINADDKAYKSGEWVSLFNGKDLTGWTPHGGEAKFEVKNGAIIGTVVPGTPSTYLSTDKVDFSDFVFTCDIKWDVNLNSGVMFRAATRDKKGKVEVFGTRETGQDQGLETQLRNPHRRRLPVAEAKPNRHPRPLPLLGRHEFHRD